jgi:TonB family protein
MRSHAELAMAVLMVFPGFVLGETLPDKEVGTPPPVQIDTEVLVAPTIKHIDLSDYPLDEIGKHGEGWVQLGFMVDTAGKPFEVTIVNSSGNKVFEDAALEALKNSSYSPGKLNGQPVESASELKITYVFQDHPKGAQRNFIYPFEDLKTAIKMKNKAAADVAMKALKSTNLYEDAYLGVAIYQYARLWGDEAQQLQGLLRALAFEKTAHYLPADDFNAAMVECSKLYLKERRYGEAMDLLLELQKSKSDPRLPAQVNPILDQLNKLSEDDRAYDVDDSMPDGSWKIQLFKRHFRAQVSDGHLTSVALRCGKGFVHFAFDPQVQYHVDSNYGKCQMELDGDRGTRFTLTQF